MSSSCYILPAAVHLHCCVCEVATPGLALLAREQSRAAGGRSGSPSGEQTKWGPRLPNVRAHFWKQLHISVDA